MLSSGEDGEPIDLFAAVNSTAVTVETPAVVIRIPGIKHDQFKWSPSPRFCALEFEEVATTDPFFKGSLRITE